MKTIERIKGIMDKKSIRQIELANKLGINKTTINAWFNNNTDPKIEQLERIAEMLEVSIEYLVTGKDSGTEYTTEEKSLVEHFRGTDDTGKKRIMEYAQDMRRLHPEQEREPETEAKIS